MSIKPNTISKGWWNFLKSDKGTTMTAASDSTLMHAITHPLQNAASIGVAGQQGSIFGGPLTTQEAYNQAAQRRVETYTDISRQTTVQITQADNGYILSFKPMDFGASPRTLVASTIEEVRDLITAEMVTRKMEK